MKICHPNDNAHGDFLGCGWHFSTATNRIPYRVSAFQFINAFRDEAGAREGGGKGVRDSSRGDFVPRSEEIRRTGQLIRPTES